MKQLRLLMLTGYALGGLALVACAFVPFAKIPFDVKLSTPVELDTAHDPSRLFSADFNGDGHLDLVSLHRSESQVLLFRGAGDGTFDAPQTIQLKPHPSGAVLRDYNGDGLPDLLVLQDESAELGVLLGNATDGLKLAGQIGLAHEDDHAQGHDHPSGITVGDYNGDGLLDVALAHEGGQLDVFFGQPNGDLEAVDPLLFGLESNQVATLDVQGDGYDDVIVLGNRPSLSDPGEIESSELLLFEGSADGLVVTPRSLSEVRSGSTGLLFVEDVDRNGFPDPVMGYAGNGMLSVLPNRGNGNFDAQQNYLVKSATSAIFADLNLDGRLDLIISQGLGEFTLGEVRLFLGAGNLRFRDPEAFKVQLAPVSVVSGDFNEDGLPDLAVANFFSHTISLIFNEPDQTPAN